ncbi:acyl-coenzyme A diphosphatase FITM2 [Ischnura elegans]|uniref:acyl-coenzyme A diphosphatase FITM2 n=1 Tax=Ischnura elegans TaxID=197161 RepID=UPI001ED8955F|nr:acyl-coenzyme A diphosphatase FITM2 [Ischnura elegans]
MRAEIKRSFKPTEFLVPILFFFCNFNTLNKPVPNYQLCYYKQFFFDFPGNFHLNNCTSRSDFPDYHRHLADVIIINPHFLECSEVNIKFINMTSKRRHPNSVSQLNYRLPESTKPETKGRKPLPEPTSVQTVFLMMIVHVCRRVLFVDTKVKIYIYLGALFAVSLVADVLPFPKTYFSKTSNVFNQYFVKLGWGWTLAVTLPFVITTSTTYCCGNRQKVYKQLLRLCIGTCMWFFWTKLFAYIESSYGKCIGRGVSVPQNKNACLTSGFLWNGLDVSGHAFILIHSSLTIIEEARAINGWEGIKDLIRNEDHKRSSYEREEYDNSPLKSLSPAEFANLKLYYEKFTPYIRGLFIAMACMMVLWDVMLISTILYFHIMVEKLISGVIAIAVWFFTYQWWYSTLKYPPPPPGEGGCFRYQDQVRPRESVCAAASGSTVSGGRKRSLGTPANGKDQLPRFMGMPLYGLANKMHDGKDKPAGASSSESDSLPPGSKLYT